MVAKTDPVVRLAMLIAAANFSETEIRDLTRRLHLFSNEDLLDLVRYVKERSHQPAPIAQVPVAVDEARGSDVTPMDGEVAMQIERLLVTEARLTRVAAAEALSKALKRRHPRRIQIPYNPKDGFSRWLKQVAGEFSLSEILHAAATVRNSKVHGLDDAWLTKR